MTDKTTAITLLRAIEAAETLKDTVHELTALYGVRPEFYVSDHHISLMIHPDTIGGLGEAMAHDAADILGADMQPEVDPDLWAHWRGRGEHNGHTIRVHVSVPPLSTEEIQ